MDRKHFHANSITEKLLIEQGKNLRFSVSLKDLVSADLVDTKLVASMDVKAGLLWLHPSDIIGEIKIGMAKPWRVGGSYLIGVPKVFAPFLESDDWKRQRVLVKVDAAHRTICVEKG